MDNNCKHELELRPSWLSGPKIVCLKCGHRWDVKSKALADFCCWMIDMLAIAFSQVFFRYALAAFASYGSAAKLSGVLLFLLVISPYIIVVHLGVFAIGHAVHAGCIRRSGDLRAWIRDDPYHPFNNEAS